MAHPVLTDLEAVKVLAAAPAVLDLFMWLAYRLLFPQISSVATIGPELPVWGRVAIGYCPGNRNGRRFKIDTANPV